MHKVFLSLGGNIGDKPVNFKRVRELISKMIGKAISTSSVYETPPWGFNSNYTFWNQVICIETILEPLEMLWRIKEIEEMFGIKSAEQRYTDRAMDIDILYVDDGFMETNSLIIPHPHIHERRFVLVPLAEIAPDFKHPLLRMTNLTLLENCKDESVIQKVEIPESLL